MSRLFVFVVSVLLCFFVYSNTHIFYPIHTQNIKPVPDFNIKSFFDGKVLGWGIVKKWNGTVVNKIYIDTDSFWENNNGIVNQILELDNCTNAKINWHIQIIDKNSYHIKSNLCNNNIIGHQYGSVNEFRCMSRRFRNGKFGDYVIEFYMYMVDKNNVIVVSKIKRFGFMVGSTIFNLQKMVTK